MPHQKEVLDLLRTGSILQGGVGSGKTLTSLAYYLKSQGGKIEDKIVLPKDKPKDLYIITTAKKRDSMDWEEEATNFYISSKTGFTFVVDSWNNITKYVDVDNSFFIFDEQKVVGSGKWAKSFIKISKKNEWILLTATPGDTWSDYIAVFVANGFYKNRTAFLRQHAIYSPYTLFPKIIKYIDEEKLNHLKNKITVKMNYKSKTKHHNIDVVVSYDEEKLKKVIKERWNIFTNAPIKNAAEAVYLMRRIVNSHPDRLEVIKRVQKLHGRVIVFYNFDYELDILRSFGDSLRLPVAEYNGHLHEDLPKNSSQWLYLVQYTSGAEAWSCIETNAIVFYSLNYSYKIITQASGRIDRWNTPYEDLYYYFIKSNSLIDDAIVKAIKNKTIFNEKQFIRNTALDFSSSHVKHML